MPERVGRYFMLLTLFIFLLALVKNETFVTGLEGIDARSATVVSQPEKQGMLLARTPHAPIVIDGDANFSAKALLEGWSGDGSPENPYIIDGLDIDLGGAYGPCVRIDNTAVSFIIRNCKLTGSWAGIFLNYVTNGELVNNIVDGNTFGLLIEYSSNCTMTDNTCTNNFEGISFEDAYYNTVANNTCSNNNNRGIELHDSNFNAFSNNTCNRNDAYGISLRESFSNVISDNTCDNNTYGTYLSNSDFNTAENNTCSSNYESGISLINSDSNIVVNNTCNNNRIGIYLYDSDSNTVANNTCLNNAEHDILEEFEPETTEPEVTEPEATEPERTEFEVTEPEYFGPLVLFLIGFVGITLLGAGWWKLSPRVGEDEIIVPVRYRLVSWFRKRRPLKSIEVEVTLEPDSSEQ